MTNRKESSEHVDIEQLAALHARARNGALATLVLTGTVIMLMWGRMELGVLALWGVASAILEGARLIVARRFRARRREPGERLLWTLAALLPASASGLLWGALAVLPGMARQRVGADDGIRPARGPDGPRRGQLRAASHGAHRAYRARREPFGADPAR